MPTHSDIEEERTAAQPEAHKIKTFRQYARGRQRGTITPAQYRILRGVLGNLFCDNVCGMILTELSNRLLLARFEVAADEVARPAAEGVELFLRDLWTRNHLPTLAHSTHYATYRDGNHAVMASWVDGRVVLTREPWWNGRSGMYVAYDSYGEPLYAVRDWKAPEGWRRTVWYPDRIERFIKSVGEGDKSGWRAIRLPSDPLTGPIAWLDAAGQPLGIPVVHFANVQEPSDGDGDDDGDDGSPLYGVSELDGGILGLQDEVNDVHRDLTANARYAGYQMVWASGVRLQQDEEGKEIPLRVEPGAIFTEANENARFGTLPPGPADTLIKTLTVKLQAVSRRSKIPMHIIGGDWPSGEAILRSERPFVDKVEGGARATGPSWASVAHISTRLANRFGGAGLDEQLLIRSVYVSPERRDLLAMAAFISQVGDRLSEEECLRLLNYSPDDVRRIMAERAEARERLGPIEAANLQRINEAAERDRQPGAGQQGIRERIATAAAATNGNGGNLS